MLLITTSSTLANNVESGMLSLLEGIPQLTTLGWNSTDVSNMCNWYGVTCVGNIVRSVNIANIELGGVLKEGIGNIGLTNLVLTNISLGGNIPGDLLSANTLLTLTLSNNNMFGNIPDEVQYATKLSVLYLDNNRFTTNKPIQFSSTSSLTTLGLSNNLLGSNALDNIHKLSKLKVLVVTNNSLPLCVSKFGDDSTVCSTSPYVECGCSKLLCSIHSSCIPDTSDGFRTLANMVFILVSVILVMLIVV